MKVKNVITVDGGKMVPETDCTLWRTEPGMPRLVIYPEEISICLNEIFNKPIHLFILARSVGYRKNRNKLN